MSDIAAAENADSKLTDLSESLGEGDFDRLENLWMEILEDPKQLVSSVADLAAVAGEGLRQGQEKIKPLLDLTWGTLSEEGEEDSDAPEAGLSGIPPGDLSALGEVLVRAFPGRKEYLAFFLDAFFEANKPLSVERAFFDACDIEGASDKNVALDRFSELLRYMPGAIVYHESGWGIGEVLEVDALLAQVKVDLEEKKGHRISIEAVDSILQVIPDGSFRGLLYRSSDELGRLVEEDPVELVQKVLDDFGSPLAQKDIKAHLTAGAIDSGDWTRWWGRTKKKLRESGFYRIGDRSPYHVEKLEEAVSFEDELIGRFKVGDWKDARGAAKQVLKGGEKKYPKAYPEIVSGLTSRLGSSSDQAVILDVSLFLSKLKNPSDVWVEPFKELSLDNLGVSLEALPTGEDPREVFRLLGEHRPDDQIPVAVAAFKCRSDSTRKVAYEVLGSIEPGELKRLCLQVYTSPRTAPEACLWLLKSRLAEKEGIGLEPLFERTAKGLLILMMDLLEHLIDKEDRSQKDRSAVRDLIKKIEPLLFHSEGAFFREGIKLMESSEREMTYKRILRHQAHLPNRAPRLLDIISQVEPVIALEEEVPEWENPDIIFSTEKGQEVLKEELRELNEVKLPAIFEAIGIAADRGDLSENAEYTSALEERDNLVSKAEKIQEDLKKIALIDASMNKEDSVVLGSRVSAENLDSGEKVLYEVLGPWDGGPEDGVLNYRSPLGQSFLGKEVDEEFDVELPGGITSYRILAIDSIFD